MSVLESESETLYRTHGATIPSLPLGGGAVSLRSALEVHLIEPLQRYADAARARQADPIRSATGKIVGWITKE